LRQRPREYEFRQEQQSGISRHKVSLELTRLWELSSNGDEFRERLEQAGYVLARGDKRPHVIVDKAGNVHSLARRIDGETAQTIRRKLQDLDPGDLPSVAAVRGLLQSSMRSGALQQEFRAAGRQVVRRKSRIPSGDHALSMIYRRNAIAVLQTQRPYSEASIRREPTGDWIRPAPTYRARRAALLADYARKIAQVLRHTHPDEREVAIEALQAERDAALEALSADQPIRRTKRRTRKSPPSRPSIGPNGKLRKQASRTRRQ
jgi:hypothetical protein